MSLELAHEEIISEENISVVDLPKSIRQSIQGVNMQVARYRKSPTPALANTIKSVSVRIADEIQDWLEESIDEEAEIAKEEAEKKAKEEQEMRAKEEEEEMRAKEAAEKIEQEKREREGNYGNSFLKGIFGI